MYKDKLFTQKYMRFYHDLAKHIYIYIYIYEYLRMRESLYYIIENLHSFSLFSISLSTLYSFYKFIFIL